MQAFLAAAEQHGRHDGRIAKLAELDHDHDHDHDHAHDHDHTHDEGTP
jgi:hypothetical protein